MLPSEYWKLIPAGTLRPGLNADERAALETMAPSHDQHWELPREAVEVQAFKLGKTPVTRGQFRIFVADGGYDDDGLWLDEEPLLSECGGRNRFVTAANTPGPRTWTTANGTECSDALPVDGVSWFEARAFSRFVGARLPNADEWEWAARAPDHRTFPWSPDLKLGDMLKANGREWAADLVTEQRKVARFDSSKLSLVDAMVDGASAMGVLHPAGNVAEWVNDEALLEDSRAVYHVLCGDLYRAGIERMHGSARARQEPHVRSPGFGFRLAMSLPL